MSKVKIFVPVLIAILLIGGYLAFQKNDDSPNLTVATNAEFPPFENYENGEYVGFDMDLCREIAAIMGKTAVINNMEFDATLVAVSTGNTDIAATGLTVNEKRKKSVDFSDTYYAVGQVLVVRADDNVFTGTTVQELEAQLVGKTIGACSGYTGQTYIEGDAEWGYPGIKDAKLKLYDGISTGVIDLQNGKLDVFILDDAVARKIANEGANKGTIRVIDKALTVENYAIAVKKGNKELLDQVNAAIKQLKDAGKIDELIAKWGL
ncbi:MAG: transporter substrate-binding domain-containing protein [Synergistes sp.]|nr:transporter substrate-binding domain-containing protein [Synergistes sp.]